MGFKSSVTKENLKNIEFPEIVFKYRDWNNTNNKRFITKREVFMSSPNQFEDKLDCKIPIRYDLMSEDQAKIFYDKLSQSSEPNLSRQQRRKIVRQYLKIKEYKSKVLSKRNEKIYFNKFFNRIGVLSLTAEKGLDKMWNKYANNHTGFCIGYNSKILFEYLGGGGKVEYVKNLPTLLPYPVMSDEEIMWKQVYFKEDKWSFEKEYRTQKFWENKAELDDRQIKLPKEAFNCVILGKNMSSQSKIEITKKIHLHIGNISIIDYKNS